MKRIPIAGPWITQKEIDYVTDAVTRTWYEDANEYQSRFETAFAAYTGRKFGSALPSCTSALHLALLSLGIRSGDEVIVPDITWIATSAPISYVGAAPVFADIDPVTWCLDAAAFEQSITPKTKAVILVNLYGNMPDMDAILSIARRHNIAVIEDAAESIGAEYKGKRAGSFGIASAFSFHGSKTLTTGEGGMLLTDDENIYNRCRFYRDHGRTPGEKMFWNTEIGYKYRMSGMQAALGLAQLERIDELIQRKREAFTWYQNQLRDFKGITLNEPGTHVKSTYWMVTAVLDPKFGVQKTELIDALSKEEIETRPFFHPLSSLPAYAKFPQANIARERNATAYRLAPYGINLPSSLSLTEEQARTVCGKLTEILLAVSTR